MNFDESVKYLYSLGNEVLAMKLGLENIGKLLEALHNPQKNYLKVQIAGTNGKGSTVAFLDSICRRAGIKTGATTSPHLVSVTERVRIGGCEISETDFARCATRVRDTAEKLVAAGALETAPTYFEQVTAIALLAFAEAKIELAILETGLGGRFDATTAARAEIVAITPIDFDHQRILGDTLAEIAAEKAAIVREDTKVILAPQQPEAERVILEKCREMGVEPIRATQEIKVEKRHRSPEFPFLTADFATEHANYSGVAFGANGMQGRYQIVNAATAISIAETLRGCGLRISKEDIRSGLELARHKGRLEFYQGVLFDGAHNAGGARALRQYLDEFIEQPVVMVFGAMRDKDLSEIAEILFPKAAFLILTKPDNPRSTEPEEILEFLPHDFDRRNAAIAGTVEEALKTASELAAGRLICVTGSLYLIGEAQNILRRDADDTVTEEK
ncbi:MAG TPA: cyanophycin synthetase [Pyrinomonadaceae bacterium]|jgi:dihydrofolate synthase/folylpolyglutamate synthase